MEYKDFSLELRETGLYIESGYSRFMLGFYEQPSVEYSVALRWCKEQNGRLPTIEQALQICEHRGKINAALAAAGHRTIGEYLWTSRQHALNDEAIYIVCMRTGNTIR